MPLNRRFDTIDFRHVQSESDDHTCTLPRPTQSLVRSRTDNYHNEIIRAIISRHEQRDRTISLC